MISDAFIASNNPWLVSDVFNVLDKNPNTFVSHPDHHCLVEKKTPGIDIMQMGDCYTLHGNDVSCVL